MSKYIKLFETHSDYNTYITGQDAILPNVSYCENENECHYNPWVETRVVAKFNVATSSGATKLCYQQQVSQFTEIEIDGVVLPNVVSEYTFSTTGEHTVRYTLADPSTIANNAFNGCINIKSINVPNNVSTIGYQSFIGCTGLTDVIISENVTSIQTSVFEGCSSLVSVTVYATTPPTLGEYAFLRTGARRIYVPNESLDAYKNASGWSDYASDIEAIQ
jgi:hypothetical protein